MAEDGERPACPYPPDGTWFGQAALAGRAVKARPVSAGAADTDHSGPTP